MLNWQLRRVKVLINQEALLSSISLINAPMETELSFREKTVKLWLDSANVGHEWNSISIIVSL